MNGTTFDTHAAVKALTEAGLGEREAEAITDTVRNALTENVVTKGDLKAGLAALETRLTIRMAGFVLTGAGLTVALVKLI